MPFLCNDVCCWILTSHVPFLGWLEPLLDRIAENKSIVVCPVIDVIEDDSFKYQYGNARATSIGGFDWNMQFNWHAIPDYERKRRDNKDYLPVRYSPRCTICHRCLCCVGFDVRQITKRRKHVNCCTSLI